MSTNEQKKKAQQAMALLAQIKDARDEEFVEKPAAWRESDDGADYGAATTHLEEIWSELESWVNNL